jgi:hypothetical protein
MVHLAGGVVAIGLGRLNKVTPSEPEMLFCVRSSRRRSDEVGQIYGTIGKCHLV